MQPVKRPGGARRIPRPTSKATGPPQGIFDRPSSVKQACACKPVLFEPSPSVEFPESTPFPTASLEKKGDETYR